MDPRPLTVTHPGGDLCEVCAALHCPGPAPSGAELPSHCHPPRDAPGGEVSQRWKDVLCPWEGKETIERRDSTFFQFPFSQRLSRYQQFKDFQRRILVATNLFGRGMDIERVNIAFNYDMPEDSDTYLHRVSSTPMWASQCPILLPDFLSPYLIVSPLLLRIFLLGSRPSATLCLLPGGPSRSVWH